MTPFRWTILAAVLFVLLSNFALLSWGVVRCSGRAAQTGRSMQELCPTAGHGYREATGEILAVLLAMGAFGRE